MSRQRTPRRYRPTTNLRVKQYRSAACRAEEFIDIIELPDSACPPQWRRGCTVGVKGTEAIFAAMALSVITPKEQKEKHGQPVGARIYFDNPEGVRYRYALRIGGMVVRQYENKKSAENLARHMRREFRKHLRSFSRQQALVGFLTTINTH